MSQYRKISFREYVENIWFALNGSDCIDQRDSLDAPAGSFSYSLGVDRDDECGLVVLSHQARGDDADHAVVP